MNERKEPFKNPVGDPVVWLRLQLTDWQSLPRPADKPAERAAQPETVNARKEFEIFLKCFQKNFQKNSFFISFTAN